ELGALLDDAARQFAEAVGGAEGSEGTLAFVQKPASAFSRRRSRLSWSAASA
ncbi:hypothetical protein H7972_33275, partial [Pseudomonas aeruginosa]|nr:hypothetical protein [Pseudomonas aeruginosa]